MKSLHYLWSLCQPCLSLILGVWLILFPGLSDANTHWKTLAPGLAHSTVTANTSGGYIEAFRIDPKQYKLLLVPASDLGKTKASIMDYGLATHALIAINAGFFDPLGQPLGLRVSEGKLTHPIRSISWWGIFSLLNNQHPSIKSLREFLLLPNIEFAIQAGPRLVINGAIPKLKTDYAPRSALCIDDQNRLIIAITANLSLTLQDFATILRQPIANNGLNCYNALNLDGGSSSQLYAAIGDFRLVIPGFANVADAIIVKPR